MACCQSQIAIEARLTSNGPCKRVYVAMRVDVYLYKAGAAPRCDDDHAGRC